jgi:hypothetical protein
LTGRPISESLGLDGEAVLGCDGRPQFLEKRGFSVAEGGPATE